MASHRFSQVLNRVVPSLSRVPKVSVSASVAPPAQIIYDHEVSMLGRTLQQGARHVGVAASRPVSAIPTNAGKVPPSLEEFDPINPGEWQLGTGGKILPRLPEGTKVGNLVMGKYGLYDPVLRKRVAAYSAGLDAGKKSEAATPFDAALTNVAKVLGYATLLIGFYNVAVLTYGKPIWPLNNLKVAGSSD